MPLARLASLWLPVLTYMVAIFSASSLSAPPVPDGVSDKTLHVLAYAGLALVIVRALAGARWSGVRRATLIGAFILTTLYGVTDEWHQRWTKGRSPEIADVGADALGALLGTIAAGSCSIIRRL